MCEVEQKQIQLDKDSTLQDKSTGLKHTTTAEEAVAGLCTVFDVYYCYVYVVTYVQCQKLNHIE